LQVLKTPSRKALHCHTPQQGVFLICGKTHSASVMQFARCEEELAHKIKMGQDGRDGYDCFFCVLEVLQEVRLFTIEFIVPYKKLITVVEQAFSEHPLRDKMNHVITNVGVNEIRRVKLVGDVFIARGLTASYLNKIIPDSTVIEIAMSGYDIFRAISDGCARYKARKVAVIATANAVYGIRNFGSNFIVSLSTYIITPDSDIDAVIRRAMAEDNDFLVGGDSVVTRAELLNVPSVRIETGKESVWQAIDEAWRLLQSNMQERIRVQRLNALVEHVHEGIIALDEDERITICNQYAQDLLGAGARECENRLLSQVAPTLNQPCLHTCTVPELGNLMELGGIQVAVNRVPIIINGSFLAGVITLQEVSQIQTIEARIRRTIHQKGLVANYTFDRILGDSKEMKKTKDLALQFSQVQANILIVGETGTGKELFAQSIHNASSRQGRPFVAVNCAALPESLLESELFGYVSGAFTGASKNGKVGLFELAHTGTIFLDEISEMSPHLQGRLLRVIEEREIMRLGDDAVIPVDIRIIAATNRNLESLVAENKFRKDLFYRLDVLRLCIPPLRERDGDIPLLMHHFLTHYATVDKTKPHTITPEALEMLERLPWNGNVRQLRNICERLSVVVDHETIGPEDLCSCVDFGGGSLVERQETKREGFLSYDSIIGALHQSGGNKAEAAKLLKIDRSTLYRWMHACGIPLA